MKKDQKHIFDQFTKRSSIVKAGSVELIPQGKTPRNDRESEHERIR